MCNAGWFCTYSLEISVEMCKKWSFCTCVLSCRPTSELHLSLRMTRQCSCCCLSGSLCRDPALGVFLALGAQVIFFAPVAGQFLILGAPDAFFAPHRSGYQGFGHWEVLKRKKCRHRCRHRLFKYLLLKRVYNSFFPRLTYFHGSKRDFSFWVYLVNHSI